MFFSGRTEMSRASCLQSGESLDTAKNNAARCLVPLENINSTWEKWTGVYTVSKVCNVNNKQCGGLDFRSHEKHLPSVSC